MSEDFKIKEIEKNRHYRFPYVQTQMFLSLVGGNKYSKVCDIGCGKGYWSYILSKHHIVKKAVYGCDLYNDYRTDEIKSLSPEIDVGYVGIDGDKLPFDKESFDLVFSVDVVEHVWDDYLFISEHIRIAKPKATILIVTPNYSRIGNTVLRLLGKLKYPRKMGDDVYGEAMHLREYTMSQLRVLIESFKQEINLHTLEITPCWVGLPLTGIGLNKFPNFLDKFCHSWFVTFKKRGNK